MIIDVTDPIATSGHELVKNTDPASSSAIPSQNRSRLQWLIDNANDTLYFPSGVFWIDDTIVFPAKTGYHIIGSGTSQNLLSGTAPQFGGASVLGWSRHASAAANEMVRVEGSGIVWNGLSLWGNHGEIAGAPRADIGLLIQPTGSQNLVAGSCWFPSLMVSECAAIGVRIQGPGAGNVAFGILRSDAVPICLQLNETGDMACTVE